MRVLAAVLGVLGALALLAAPPALAATAQTGALRLRLVAGETRRYAVATHAVSEPGSDTALDVAVRAVNEVTVDEVGDDLAARVTTRITDFQLSGTAQVLVVVDEEPPAPQGVVQRVWPDGRAETLRVIGAPEGPPTESTGFPWAFLPLPPEPPRPGLAYQRPATFTGPGGGLLPATATIAFEGFQRLEGRTAARFAAAAGTPEGTSFPGRPEWPYSTTAETSYLLDAATGWPIAVESRSVSRLGRPGEQPYVAIVESISLRLLEEQTVGK